MDKYRQKLVDEKRKSSVAPAAVAEPQRECLFKQEVALNKAISTLIPIIDR